MKMQLIQAKILYYNGYRERKVFLSFLSLNQYISRSDAIIDVRIVEPLAQKIRRKIFKRKVLVG